MIKKITRETHPDDFDSFIEDNFDISYNVHRRGSNFYSRWIFLIDEKYFPDHPELWGFWESNMFIDDADFGQESNSIHELTRVEKVKKVVETEVWQPV